MISAPDGHLRVRRRIELDLPEMPLRIGDAVAGLQPFGLAARRRPVLDVERARARSGPRTISSIAHRLRRPMRLVNQLESGTSSSVLTLTAGVSRRSPGLRNVLLDEIEDVAFVDRPRRRRRRRRGRRRSRSDRRDRTSAAAAWPDGDVETDERSRRSATSRRARTGPAAHGCNTIRPAHAPIVRPLASRSRYDVVILGGGLAGLTLARQLDRSARRSACSSSRSAPTRCREAAFKVGESTVEIAARYFGHVLGLAPHMAERQLAKFGLRYFFSDGSNRDITQRYELGPRYFPRIGSYQLDRGRLENYLFDDESSSSASSRSIGAVGDGASTFGDPRPHRHLRARRRGAHGARPLGRRRQRPRRHPQAASSGCASRAGMSPTPRGGACKGRVKVDDWSTDPAWQARVDDRPALAEHRPPDGPGLLVLADSARLGLDQRRHRRRRGDASVPHDESAREGLRSGSISFEPQAAAALRPYGDNVEDFLALQHFAHSCERVFSGDRWCLTGEAGVFTDPFYSPGSDFIAIGNDFICEMIGRDVDGEDIRARAAAFNEFYLRLFEAYIKVYETAVPDHGPRARDDREGGVGQRVLLGHHGAAVLPAQVPRPRVPAVDRAADAALLRAAHADAAVPARLASARAVAARRRLRQRHRRRLPAPPAGRARRSRTTRRACAVRSTRTSRCSSASRR